MGTQILDYHWQGLFFILLKHYLKVITYCSRLCRLLSDIDGKLCKYDVIYVFIMDDFLVDLL